MKNRQYGSSGYSALPDTVNPTDAGKSTANRSAQSGQGALGDGWSVVSTLLAGIVVWGLLGWCGDAVFNTEFLLPVGLLVGFAAGIYLVIVKYGHVGDGHTGSRQVADVPRHNDTEGTE